MKNILKQIACIMMTLTMVAAYAPPGLVWAVNGAPEEISAEGADDASSVITQENEDAAAGKDGAEDTETIDDSEAVDSTEDTGINDEATVNNEDSNEENDEEIIKEEENDTALDSDPAEVQNTPALRAAGSPEESILKIDENIENGTVTLDGTHGTAAPDTDYDLATVRQLWTDPEGKEHEQYLEYTYNENSGTYSFEADPEIENSEITAFFFCLKKWDGAVDLTWYDPDQTEFEIGTPAQLAGLAAITNGMVDNFTTDDNKVTTEEYMIKDNEGRSFTDGAYTHRYLSTEPWLVDLLTPNASSGTSPEASQVRDTAWRLPEVEHNKLASDDMHNDFLYRTVKLTADLDMSGANWTPIGGKYAMNRDAASGKEAKVIDTRFQGVFDGQGHTVTLDCNRQAKMGFPYAMEIALVGYLGGGVDYENGYPKDTCMDYAKYWVPTVRNVVVDGAVKGRRMVGGVVGRIGETNYGVVVENCVNNADVQATDMRGVAGIVGAAWGKSVIRNCYNTGTILSGFWEHGGIVGSNGYEGSGNRPPCAANVYNCYNVGDSGINTGNNQYSYDGHEVGVDGNANAGYEIANCYYIEPDEVIEGKTGYCTGETSKNKNARLRSVEGMAPSDMKTEDFVNRLNMNGEVFVSDENNINGGYPILYYQSDAHFSGSASITLDKAGTENGTIAFVGNNADTLTDNPYGSIADLSAKAAAGYRLVKYIVTTNDGSGEYEMISGNFVAATGKDITVRAIFEEVSKTTIVFNEPEDEGKLYYVEVVKVGRYNGSENEKIDPPEVVRSGDGLDYRDRIRITGIMKPWGDREPDDNNTEYTGKLSDPYEDPSLKKVAGTTNVFEITGESDIANIQFKPKTQGKRWSSRADTSWYTGSSTVYVIKTTQQLAGVARLCMDGRTDFNGVTIKLGNDISLANIKANGGNGYEISWFGIGVARTPFRGTFDGQGYTVRYMHRNFAPGYCEISAGALGGLFGVTDGAVIRNVKVESGTYTNDVDMEMQCGFINGASGGGIVGTAIDTLVENCTANIPMTAGVSGTIGGIAGEIEGSTVIRNCTGNCLISSSGENTGGIAAVVSGSNPRIEKCINNGDITSTKWKVGGILGSGESNAATISQCVNNGNISTSMKGTSSAVHSMGGIAGYSAGPLTISQCVNKGALSGYQQTYAMGGIAGAILRGTITDSINFGEIYSESTSKWAEVSGLANVGTKNSTIATVKNSYNAGKITLGEGFSPDAKKNVGGVTGYGNAVTNVFSNVFCTDTSVAASGGTAGVAGKVVSEDQLRKDPASLLGESFVPDINNVNGGYPVLAWQDPVAAEAARKASSAPAAEATKAPVIKLLPAMKIKSAKNSKKKAVVIKWKRVKNAAGYQILRATSKRGKYKVIKTVKVTKKLKKKKTLDFTNKKLKKKKTYYYKIRYYKKVSGEKVYSELSTPKKVKIKK